MWIGRLKALAQRSPALREVGIVPVLPVASVASAEVRFQECHDFRFFQVLLDVAELLNLRAYARTYAA